MITQLNFTKFNGCPRQAYFIEHTKAYQSLRDKAALSGRLKDVQRDMLKSFPYGAWVYGDVKSAARDTMDIIKAGEEVIFNATFLVGKVSCKCDVIMKNGDEYDIYAVRPTSRYTRWIDEVLYSAIVMEMAGIKAGNCYVCAIDKAGSRGKVLTVIDVYNEKRKNKLYERLKSIFSYIRKDESPDPVLSKQCGACPYLDRCFAKEENSIFTLKSLQFNKKMSLYQKGIKTVEDYEGSREKDERVLREIMVRNTDEDVYDKDEINKFLSQLSYPLGFLDFETMEVFNPMDKVLKPMDTVITQFSYHVIEKEGDEATHYEFIGDGVNYCEREAAEKLSEYIGENHCVLMYSDYEKTCIERLMKRLPEYRQKLEVIKNNLVDLEKPFSGKILVNRRMEGKSSLKKVLPALYPSDSSLDYKKMKIQNGQQAESVYARLHKMDPYERECAVKDLKDYCALDTLAMIKLWEKLEYYGKMV